MRFYWTFNVFIYGRFLKAFFISSPYSIYFFLLLQNASSWWLGNFTHHITQTVYIHLSRPTPFPQSNLFKTEPILNVVAIWSLFNIRTPQNWNHTLFLDSYLLHTIHHTNRSLLLLLLLLFASNSSRNLLLCDWNCLLKRKGSCKLCFDHLSFRELFQPAVTWLLIQQIQVI